LDVQAAEGVQPAAACELGAEGEGAMRGKAAGSQRERAVRDLLIGRDWVAFRAPASLGCADVVAMRADHRPRLIEVKSTKGGPYERFGPKERARLSAAARVAGAEAFLAWWPSRGPLRWIPEQEWPPDRAAGRDDAARGD
jgi:Holliday junction resolvase